MRSKSSKQKHKQPSPPNASSPANAPDELVVDAQARRECGNVCRMTFNRWAKNPKLQLPPAVLINNRKYRWRSQLEKFKEKLRAMGRHP